MWSDPERVSGRPLFRGIPREQVHGFLEIAFRELIEPMDRTEEAEARYRLAVVQLDAPSNDANDLLPLVPRLNDALKTLSPGDFRVIG